MITYWFCVSARYHVYRESEVLGKSLIKSSIYIHVFFISWGILKTDKIWKEISFFNKCLIIVEISDMKFNFL